ncbi:MAG: branched-chain amino acid ABC transporter permease [Rhodospirillales bacterium]|nr:branched-chain amino acid ABC transporter permease [Rhodospirillales bacterium]
MFYREAGQFKTTYQDDQAIFPIPQDRWGMAVILAVAYAVIPAIADDYWLRSILIPFLIYSLGAIGLNILTGYAGQLSLGTAGFMAVGAFAAYNFSIRLPEVPLLVNFAASGFIAAGVGMLFGIPSLRIKGFYLAVATLAAQFFLIWLFTRVGWFTNYSSSGVITAPRMQVFGIPIDSSASRYLFTLSVVAVLALAAKNMVRGNIGRKWMAIRDMDIAAEIIGISPLGAKLSAFAVSSFYCGVAGALWAYLYLGTVEPDAFGVDRSFQFLFMIIIGGLGSILGSFLGAGFIVLLPILITNVGYLATGGALPAHVVTHTQYMIFGALIVFFLIVEPHGLARLWQIGKEKLRLWPFPY